MKHFSILAILIAMGALTALSIDIYLPAMGLIAEDLGTGEGTIQWTISIFMLSFAVGQLIYGPLSDRYGRKITLVVGLLLYGVANLWCALATGPGWLVAGRFVQGLGACAGLVSSFAIARDLYSGTELTQVLAKVASVRALAPILAPILGAQLTILWGWRASFYFLFLFTFGFLVWMWIGLPETHLQRQPTPLNKLLPVYAGLFKNRLFMRYSMVNSFVFAGLFVFISAGSPLLIGAWDLSPSAFAWCFGSNALMYMVGSIFAGRVATRFTTAKLALAGTLLSAFGSVLLLLLSSIHQVWAVLLPMYVMTFGVAWALPASTSGSLESLGDRAGTATALQGFLRFSISGLVGAGLSLAPIASALPLGLAMTACLLLACIFLLFPEPTHHALNIKEAASCS